MLSIQLQKNAFIVLFVDSFVLACFLFSLSVPCIVVRNFFFSVPHQMRSFWICAFYETEPGQKLGIFHLQSGVSNLRIGRLLDYGSCANTHTHEFCITASAFGGSKVNKLIDLWYQRRFIDTFRWDQIEEIHFDFSISSNRLNCEFESIFAHHL